MENDTGLQREYWEKEHSFRRYDHPVVQFFAGQRIRYLQQFIDLSQAESLLDVGCGGGFSNYYLSRYVEHTWGIDRSYQMLNQNPVSKERLIEGDALHLPFRDSSFDIAIAWELLHHIEVPSHAIQEMARVSRKWVIIFEPNCYNPANFVFAIIDRSHHWVLRYSKSFLISLASDAGLTVVHCSVGGWIFPNKTPTWLFKIIKKMPFRLPFIGISNFLICEKKS
jgi:ubiquinone/menaquinone biosynthesis C-methylase UbiE